MIIQDQFGTIQNLQRALIPKTSNWSGTILGRFLQQIGSSEDPDPLYIYMNAQAEIEILSVLYSLFFARDICTAKAVEKPIVQCHQTLNIQLKNMNEKIVG